MSLTSDLNQNFATVIAGQKESNRWAFLQTTLLVHQLSALTSIRQQMEEVKRANVESLAVHQEMLRRDSVQRHIEEFIYQTQKIVEEMSDETTDVPASTRYFYLLSILEKAKDEGIGTPIVRGRDNKAALEKVLQDIQRLTTEFARLEEVQEAIAWAKEFEKKRQDERNRLTELMTPCERSLDILGRSRDSATFGDAFLAMRRQYDSLVPEESARPIAAAAAIAAVLLLPISVPVLLGAFWYFKSQVNRARNAAIDTQTPILLAKLENLKDQLASV